MSKDAKKNKEIFAIQCFKNGKRLYTDKLTLHEMRCLRITAEHLIKHLKKLLRNTGE